LDRDHLDPASPPTGNVRDRDREPPARSRAGGWPLAAVLAALAILFYEVRLAILPFVIAIAIAFIVEPAVGWIEKRTKRRRWPGAILLYVAIVALLAGAAWWVGSVAVSDLVDFAQRAPATARNFLVETIGPQGITAFGHRLTPDDIVERVSRSIGDIGLGIAAQGAAFGIAVLMGGVLTLVLLFYFMLSGPRLAAGAIWLIPPERRWSVERLLPQLIPALRRYLAGVLGIVLYTALVAWIGFGPVFRLPHAVLLALAVGVLEIVPVIGPAASMTLVGITAFEQHSLSAIIFLMAFVVLLRLSIDNIVGPIALGQAARLHPVVIIFSFLVGAILFGVAGLILAVPTAVCIKTILQHYYAEPIAN
jgi:predicted PurR-regulated permease PerM